MSGLTGTLPLARLALRRDRVLLPAWLGVLVVTAASSSAATSGIYPTRASRISAAEAVNGSPSLVALYGKVYDPTSLGAVSLIKMIAMGSALVGLLTLFLVVRHTRAEEEAGRLELVGATVVGRFAPLAAALLVVGGASVLLGLMAAGGLIATGLPVEGSLVFGAAWAGNGLAFAAVAGLCAQLTTTGRAATGLAAAVLGGSYLLRAVGDTRADDGAWWLSWLSPVGWSQQLRPFAGDRWGVVLLSLLFTALVTTAAFALAARRDHGAGLLADRAGPATGRLGSPLALAWRLQRGSLLGWTVGYAVMGVVLGGLASDIGGFFGSPEAQDWIRRLGGQQSLTDAYLATELGFGAVITTAFALSSVLRLRREETDLRAEPLLSTAVSRLRLASSHLVIALLGSAWLMLLTGFTVGLVHGGAEGRPGREIARLTGAAVAHLPAVLVVVGLAVAAFGLLPRAASLAWGALVGFLLLGELGPVLRLPQWVQDLSPYAHSPRLPGGPVEAGSLVGLCVVAAVLLVAGLLGWQRRDVG